MISKLIQLPPPFQVRMNTLTGKLTLPQTNYFLFPKKGI